MLGKSDRNWKIGTKQMPLATEQGHNAMVSQNVSFYFVREILFGLDEIPIESNVKIVHYLVTGAKKNCHWIKYTIDQTTLAATT